MYLILLLSFITNLVFSSDPSEVFTTVDDRYFKDNHEINIRSGKGLSIECASTVIGSAAVNYKWYRSKTPYTTQIEQRVEVSQDKTFAVLADSSHSGFYMCLIRSQEGYSVFTPVIHVVVEYFDITTEHESVTIEPFEKVFVLRCSQINANPAPIVTWKKDGVDVTNINLDRNVMHVTGKVVDNEYKPNINDLVLLNYQDTYAGTYTCDVKATGTFFQGRSSTANSYSVKTAASQSLMTDNSTQILFIDNGGRPRVGESTTLRCGASGFPTPEYEWHDTNDMKLTTSDVYDVLETSMVVKSIKSSDDNAEYKCAAISGKTKSVEPIRLKLADTLPQFNNSMDNSQYNIPGATVIIDFGLKVKGEALYLWNGIDLAQFVMDADDTNLSNRGVLVLDSTTNILRIEGIQKNASGIFQCIVYNEAGMVNQYKTVIIRDAQPAQVIHTTVTNEDITVLGNNIHSVRGANFTMQCTGSGNPTPSDITIDVPDSTGASITSSLVKVNKEGKYIGNLLIDKVSEAYAGNYSCCTHNFIAGVKNEACITINLAVEEKVSVTQNSKDTDYTLVIGNQVYGTLGYPLAASCKATGLPRPSITITREDDSCGSISTITKSNDIEFTDKRIIEVEYGDDCTSDIFQCCGKNMIQGTAHEHCYEAISVSFVEGAQPSEVKIENSGTLAADDSSLVSLMETLTLNCSAKSFPETDFSWEFRNAGSTSNVFQPLDNLNFQTSLTKTKGFTYSILNTYGVAGDFFTGTNYEFKCTGKNVFGGKSVIKIIQITTSAANEVSASVYLSVGIVLFFVALIAIFVMYIFFLISSGKRNKKELGCMRFFICKCCEPKELPVVGYLDGTYNSSLYTDQSYTMRSNNMDNFFKHMKFDDDEFGRGTVVYNPENEQYDNNRFSLNSAVYKDPDVV